MRHAIAGVVVSLPILVLLGCAADAQPLETDLVVSSAGPGSPVAEGTRCVLRMQPAWRQGVNCQVLVRCEEGQHGEQDLFGGRRIGGYAVCDYADDAFLSALDGEPRTDGDPAIDLDLARGTLLWRGPRAGESATLRVDGEARVAAAW